MKCSSPEVAVNKKTDKNISKMVITNQKVILLENTRRHHSPKTSVPWTATDIIQKYKHTG